MTLERVESPGLAHYSYIVEDQREAIIIDPRRDWDVYVEKTVRRGIRVVAILETHRNEDYLVGSAELARRTGAEVWHADGQLPYEYGLPVEDGQEFFLGRLRLKAILTPGHTAGSMSYLLHDDQGGPWMIFTGDLLLSGTVGRVDLFGKETMRPLAESMHASLFERILPLGDGIIVCPAHGSGSICGYGIAPRPWTTIGLERRSNAHLKHASREAFVESASRWTERPPYFAQMELRNLEGALLPQGVPAPPPLTPQEFREQMLDAQVIDTRSIEAFGGGHVPGALSIFESGLPMYAGWFLGYRLPILLVSESDDVNEAVRHLIRLGYDHFGGYLSGGMRAWYSSASRTATTGTITADELCRTLDAGAGARILDVRSHEERKSEGRLATAIAIPLTELPRRWEEIPAAGPLAIFCGSGTRSMLAASFLGQRGRTGLTVVLGGVPAWNSTACPIEL